MSPRITKSSKPQTPYYLEEDELTHNAAEHQATLSPDGTLQQHQSLTLLLLHLEQQQHHITQTPTTTTTTITTNDTATSTSLPKFKQLVSYSTGFAALTLPIGDVYTWGDERYGACLGRDISSSASTSSADQPGLVTALQDLPTGPVRKVAAGGYVLAALTAGDDLYLWGGGGGGSQPGGRKGVPAGMVGDEPTPVDLDGRDIADVAIGDSHLVVLTTEGEVFVVGHNGNGQLGLPGDKYAESWTRVELGLQDGRRAVGVAAGPRNSFILVQKGAT
ncbi:hypothetical protein VPNG_04660 [Cytospora leucostoma]|uniref:Regulator of chromosome condensation 1/beta-lactamase-inhibitor protein II n=1 Tax=Cytospora leucostoma TaxID=1230097 RepID=A0A423XAG1_9PEZI|nr:hypothetical protein VPNG_04660 [Cytospora leucostoma]